MAVNFPGEYAVEIAYGDGTLEHTMLLSVAVVGNPAIGTNVDSIDVTKNDASTANLDISVKAFVNLVKTMFNGAITFGEYTLWRYEPQSFDRTFISTGNIGESGTASGSTNLAGQHTTSFRSNMGGIARITFLESAFTSRDKVKASANTATNYQDFITFVTGDDGFFLARDNGRLINAINFSGGENEAIFRKRFRNS